MREEPHYCVPGIFGVRVLYSFIIIEVEAFFVSGRSLGTRGKKGLSSFKLIS